MRSMFILSLDDLCEDNITISSSVRLYEHDEKSYNNDR